MVCVIVTGTPGRGKTTLCHALAKAYDMQYVASDAYIYEPSSWTKRGIASYLFYLLARLWSIQDAGQSWILDVFIDGSDPSHRALELVNILFAQKPALVLFTGGDLETTIRRVTARHEERVRTRALICSGMEETDEAFARLVDKLRANWEAITKLYDEFEVPEFVRTIRITGDEFATVDDVASLFAAA